MAEPLEAKVEALLSSTWGAKIEITRSTQLAPWFVYRCELQSSRQVPASVIVKGMRAHPGDPQHDPARVFAERAALELLDELAPGLAPRCLASAPEARLTVLEDLRPRVALDEILRGDDEDAKVQGLDAFARALGRLHARSFGHEHDYYARRCAFGPVDPVADRQQRTLTYCQATCRYMTSLGVAPSHGAEVELSDALDALTQPGGFVALSSGDAGENNYLTEGTDGRLIDFEFAGYRHALGDASCLHVPGPLWITLRDPIATGIEDAYRSVLQQGVAEASDDERFGFGMAAACLLAALSRLARFPRLDERRPGDHSRLQMVSVLQSAARAADAHRALPRLRAWLSQIAAALRRRWPDADVDLGAYAAYVSRKRDSNVVITDYH
jgi:hypothetical protein